MEHFRRLSNFYLTAKFHKNRINGLEDISGRTDARTDGRDSLGLKRLRRETKKLANFNERIVKKMPKTSIFVHFGPKWDKWEFFSKKKTLGTFFGAYKPQVTAKFHKKVMNGFRETASLTNERTNERTDVIP